MKYLLYISLALMGGFGVTQAQTTGECGFTGNSCELTNVGGNIIETKYCPSDERCVGGGAVPMDGGPVITKGCQKIKRADGTECLQILIPSTNNNNGNNTGNKNTSGEADKKPCPNPIAKEIERVFTVRKAPVKIPPALMPVKTSGFASGFAGFLRGLGIIAGDNKCKPVLSAIGQKYQDCLTVTDQNWYKQGIPADQRHAEEPYYCAKQLGITVTQATQESKPIGNTCDKS